MCLRPISLRLGRVQGGLLCGRRQRRPLTQAEVGQLEEAWPHVAPCCPKRTEGRRGQGLAVRDADGDLVTPLVGGKECAFTVFDADGTAKCGWSAPTSRARPNGASP